MLEIHAWMQSNSFLYFIASTWPNGTAFRFGFVLFGDLIGSVSCRVVSCRVVWGLFGWPWRGGLVWFGLLGFFHSARPPFIQLYFALVSQGEKKNKIKKRTTKKKDNKKKN